MTMVMTPSRMIRPTWRTDHSAAPGLTPSQLHMSLIQVQQEVLAPARALPWLAGTETRAMELPIFSHTREFRLVCVWQASTALVSVLEVGPLRA